MKTYLDVEKARERRLWLTQVGAPAAVLNNDKACESLSKAGKQIGKKVKDILPSFGKND